MTGAKPRDRVRVPHEATHGELLAHIRRLEAELAAMDDEHAALDTLMSQLRSCLDPHCCMCRECVVTLFIRAQPAPLTIPKRYVEAPWRR